MMAGSEGLRGSPDDQEVNLDDTDEVRHYVRLFDTTEDMLKEAVIHVGTSAAKVKRYLQSEQGRSQQARNVSSMGSGSFQN
jgi:hypothetical protein